jgi:hypothetical protein
VRIWFSGPRLLNGLVRPGVSLGREDFGPPRLPSWRRHELRAALQTAAKKKGETLSVADANYLIDKSLASGLLDSNGDLDFKVKGETRDECIEQIIEIATMWNHPMTGAEAGAILDRAAETEKEMVGVGRLLVLLDFNHSLGLLGDPQHRRHPYATRSPQPRRYRQGRNNLM